MRMATGGRASAGDASRLAMYEQFLDHVFWRSASLPANAFLRAIGALHLARAKEDGFRKIYCNDQHLPADPTHFGLNEANVVQQCRVFVSHKQSDSH